ncbi:MAG: glycosyltransferase family 2 protein [Thermomicrobiales bacterium]|nr:glycosyltransferase family 2 protein [Thermomicrobiales bacterium]
MVALTIGMATYNDFDGVYFTLQALRLYQNLDDVELLVVDNYGCDDTKRFVEQEAHGRYVRATDVIGTSPAKNRVFVEARGKAVLCCDSHVLFVPKAIARLKAYYRKHPKCIDLLQGPLLADNFTYVSTHLQPTWNRQMWGGWATDPRGADPHGKPFEIWAQGMGVFSCRCKAWPGFNPAFRGFGGEEGYIHEKFRQRGGRALCLPWLRWVHRFSRPKGNAYPLSTEAKLRNYLIGHVELGLDVEPVLEHFAHHLRPEALARVREEVLGERGGTGRAKKTRKPKKKAMAAPVTSAALNGRARVVDGGVADAAAGAAGDTPVALLFGPGATISAEEMSGGRAFPLLPRDAGEPEADHVARVSRLIDAAMAGGATHLLVPTALADWLGDHPHVRDYFAASHELAAASMETGFLFILRQPEARVDVGQAATHDD